MKKLFVAFVVMVMSAMSFAGQINGSINASTKYIDKGYVENDNPTIQLELLYQHENFYVGYFGSTLNYEPATDSDHGFENDVYVGVDKNFDGVSTSTYIGAYTFSGKSTIELDSKRKTTEYVLGNEIYYENFGLSSELILVDNYFSNRGDLYSELSWYKNLPYEMTLKNSIGVYAFNDSSDDDHVTTSKNLVVSNVSIELSKQLQYANVYGKYVHGGKNRNNEDLPNNFVFGLKYEF